MILATGDFAEFQAYDRTIRGHVVAISPCGIYLVVGEDQSCGMYGDGLFRFTERNVRCKLNSTRTQPHPR